MNLHFKKFGDFGEDVILIHGLLGASDNLQTLGKKLSETYRVWLPDIRNHGRSPHSEEMNYPIMMEDLLAFVNQNNILKTHLVGHSMGGKVAMNFALNHPERVGHLIILDIAPKKYIGDHLPILNAMLSVDLSLYHSRSEVEKEIAKSIRSRKIIQLILKNMGRNESGFYWKPNVKALLNSYPNLMNGVPDRTQSFDGATAFVKGENSDYINMEEWEGYKHFFPNAKLYEVPDAGHWVHADQSEYVENLVLKILGE